MVSIGVGGHERRSMKLNQRVREIHSRSLLSQGTRLDVTNPRQARVDDDLFVGGMERLPIPPPSGGFVGGVSQGRSCAYQVVMFGVCGAAGATGAAQARYWFHKAPEV